MKKSQHKRGYPTLIALGILGSIISCSDEEINNVKSVDYSDWQRVATEASESDVTRGQRVIQMCAGCHAIEKGAPSPAGPSLFGIVGRQVGSVEGYPYTQALSNQKERWTVKQFEAFITSPQDLYPGTGMAFSGLKKREDRTALIAYLASTSPLGQ
jgi:cytochrome c